MILAVLAVVILGPPLDTSAESPQHDQYGQPVMVPPIFGEGKNDSHSDSGSDSTGAHSNRRPSPTFLDLIPIPMCGRF